MNSPSPPQSTPSPVGADPRHRFWHRFQLVILALFVVLAFVYVWVQQPRYGPDEPRHVAYIRLMVDQQRLPEIRDGVELEGAHSQHPPLYYLLVAPVYLAARGFGEPAVYYALKCLAPLMMLGGLLCFRSTLRRTFPDRPFAATAALAVVALLPEFLLESCVVNNDTLTVALASLFLLICVRSLDRGPCLRIAIAAGLVLAAIANTKSTGLTLAPLGLLTVLIRWKRHGGRPVEWVRDAGVGYGLLALLGSWWYLWNIQRYGQPMVFEFYGGQLQPKHPETGAVLTPLEVYTTGEAVPLAGRALLGLFQSFWSQIDWIPVHLREPIWYGLLALVLTAAVGLLADPLRFAVGWVKERSRAKLPGEAAEWGSPLLVLCCGYLLNYGSILYIATFVHLGFYQGGRYLMPGVFGAGALLGAGLNGWLRQRKQRPQSFPAVIPLEIAPALAVVLTLAFVALNVLCIVELVTYLNPTFVRPWPGT